jgi:hypothetical protein
MFKHCELLKIGNESAIEKLNEHEPDMPANVRFHFHLHRIDSLRSG